MDKKHQDRQTFVESLTDREAEILQLIVDGLSNNEIADKLFVALSTVKKHINNLYSKLHVSNRDEAIKTAVTFNLVVTTTQSPTLPPHNLPIQSLQIIGRETEVRAIVDLLNNPSKTIVTITGQGGSGKTRLALEIAQQLKDQFQDGTFWIPLAPLSKPDQIMTSLADAIDMDLSPHESVEDQLIHYLLDKEILFVLDNFEHLLDRVDSILVNLPRASNVKLLITSREPLNISTETQYPIDGLPYPLSKQTDRALEYPALQLFQQSAQRMDTGFQIDADNLERVIKICDYVQGMPLAIEMVTGWVRLLSLNEIVAELSSGLELLVDNRRDIPERHRTIRAVFDYSWRLLSPDEQNILMGLSVFPDGFLRDAAKTVVGATLIDLSRFVNKSLLYRDDSGRYQLHQLFRQYMAKKLSQTPNLQRIIWERYTNYYADFMQHHLKQLHGEDQLGAWSEIHAEIANILVGWQESVRGLQFNLMEKYVRTLWNYYEFRALFRDGLTVFNEALEKLQTITNQQIQEQKAYKRVYGVLLLAKRSCQMWLADWQVYEQELELNSTLLKEIGALRDYAKVVSQSGHLHYIRGNYDRSEQDFLIALEICEELQDEKVQLEVLNGLGRVAYRLGDYQNSEQRFQNAIEIGQQIGSRNQLFQALAGMSRVSYAMGDFDHAEQLIERSYETSKEIGSFLGMAYSLTVHSNLEYRQGNHLEAKTLAMQALDMHTQVNEGNQSRNFIARVHRQLGQIATALHEYPLARQHYYHALTSRSHYIVTTHESHNIILGIAVLLGAEGNVTQAFELTAFLSHQDNISHDLKQEIETLTTQLEPALNPEIIADTYEHISSQDLSTVVSSLLDKVQLA